MMQSKVQALAKEKGLKTVQELAWATKLTWPTAHKVWKLTADLSKTRGNTLRSLANGLDCKIEDLYIVIEED